MRDQVLDTTRETLTTVLIQLHESLVLHMSMLSLPRLAGVLHRVALKSMRYEENAVSEKQKSLFRNNPKPWY